LSNQNLDFNSGLATRGHQEQSPFPGSRQRLHRGEPARVAETMDARGRERRLAPQPMKVRRKSSPERVPAVPWHLSWLKDSLMTRWGSSFRSIGFVSVLVKIEPTHENQFEARAARRPCTGCWLCKFMHNNT